MSFTTGARREQPAATEEGIRGWESVAERLSSRDRRLAFRLGIINGILFGFGLAFADPNIVLPVYVSKLTTSRAAIGLLSALTISGWLIPQLICAHYMQDRPHKMPLYRWTAVVRSLSWLIVAPSAFLWAGREPGLTLGLFFLGYAAFTLGGGAGSIAFFDVVAKTVPGNRLGTFFGARNIGGGLLAILAGVVVRHILGPAGPGFPANFGWLLALAGVVCTVALAMFGFIREPAGEVHPKSDSLVAFLLGAPRLLHADRNFRGMFAASLLMGAATMTGPFYIIFARSHLGMPPGMAGDYLSVQMLGTVLSNILWLPLGDRRDGRTVMLAAGVVALAAPLAALGIALAGMHPQAAGRALFAVFFLAGATGVGTFLGFTKYLIELAPEAQRPRYVGAFNTFGAVVAAFPVCAGLVVEHVSFQAAFAAAAVAGMLGLAAAARLTPLGGKAPEVVSAPLERH